MPPLSDPTYRCSDTTDTSLASFFARPIKIYAFTWNVGSSVLATPNPWQLYFNNARVINRITNYRNIRCRLHLRIVLNGNGFHYGRMLASYLPYANIDIVSAQGRATAQDAIAESQRLHVYLDPSISQGGTITVPFYYHKNNLDVISEEWDDMGDLVIRSLQPLAHANGATDSVTVSVFAWISEVVLSGPTSTDSGALVPQAGEYDEYMKTPVSSISNTVAAIAGTLTTVPLIAPFAMATQMLSTSISQIAVLFGFSRPAVLEPIVPYKPTYHGNLANVNMPDSCVRLTADSKQELTVDPRTVGLPPQDELSIISISQRESYLTQFAWDISDTAETLLWNCYVSPVLFDTVGAGSYKEYHFTPPCFAAHPFKFWRGTIKYRFMIVASAYQKGRIRIVYDPWLKTGTEYNTNYNSIIDLAGERDFTVEIGWANSRSFLKVYHANLMTILPFNTSALTTAYEDYMNGVISVFVVNELTTPNSTVTNNAAVNVLVSTSDDFQVGVPTADGFTNMTTAPEPEQQAGEYAFYVNQSGHADQDQTTEGSSPQQTIVTDSMAAGKLDVDDTWKVYIGDPIVSFRTLMKRYTTSMYNPVPVTNSCKACTSIVPIFPIWPGYYTDGLHQVTTPVNPTAYNYAFFTFLNYVVSAFAGWRGSIRWKHHYESTDDYLTRISASLNNLASASQMFTAATGPVKSASVNFQARFGRLAGTPDGTYVSNFDRNPVLEVEYPYYSFNRFSPVRTYLPCASSEFNPLQTLDVVNYQGTLTDGQCGVHSMCAAGEDFMPSFFIGPPIFYFPAEPTHV